jgi:hypothetical protein
MPDRHHWYRKVWIPAVMLAMTSVSGALADATRTEVRPLTDPRFPVIMDDWPVRLDGRHQLFIDDDLVAQRDGVQRVVLEARKHPANPVLRPEHPWEDDMVLLYGSVVRDPASQQFMMWYLARDFDDKNPFRTVVCYARSADGVTWEKPNLGIIEYRGTKENNIVALNHGQGLDDIIAFIDPKERDPDRRFKMLVYQLQTPEMREGVYMYMSPDGIHWEERREPIIRGVLRWPQNADHQFRGDVMVDGVGDVTTILYDPVLGHYVANLKTLIDGKRSRMQSESDDLIHWTRPRVILVPDEQDGGTQCYGMCGFPYESLWLAVVQRFHAVTDLTLDLTWAVSHDGRNWSRVEPRDPFLPVGPAGAWDSGNNSHANNPPIRVGDELWFYYGGRNAIHNVRPGIGAIGLATLPVDRFVALRAAQSGTIVTRPLHFDRGRLHVNVNAQGGSLRVEIRDRHGRMLAGYGAGNCRPVDTDTLDQVVTWNAKDTVVATEAPVRLCFHLDRADLYSFWIE